MEGALPVISSQNHHIRLKAPVNLQATGSPSSCKEQAIVGTLDITTEVIDEARMKFR